MAATQLFFTEQQKIEVLIKNGWQVSTTIKITKYNGVVIDTVQDITFCHPNQGNKKLTLDHAFGIELSATLLKLMLA
jgi:hypothetical protein